MPLLSIIVPIYNVENYLHKCIDSILVQSFGDYELILIDDGSTDNSSIICDEYASKDNRIKVIHKENGGLSEARNVGLDIASGKYIGFIDSDDFICSDMYAKMIRVAEESKSEIVSCCINFVKRTDKGYSGYVWPILNEQKMFSREEILNGFFPDMRNILMPTVWNKIYVSKIFEDLRFPVGKPYEDSYLQLRILSKCKKIVVVQGAYYNYLCNRDGSIMNTKFDEKNFCKIDIAINYIKFFECKKIKSQKGYALDYFIRIYLYTGFLVKYMYPQYLDLLWIYTKQVYIRFFELITNKQTCRMLKVVLVIFLINKKMALKICRKIFPECVSDELL